MSIHSDRNQREKNEAKLSGQVAQAFNAIYKDKFQDPIVRQLLYFFLRFKGGINFTI